MHGMDNKRIRLSDSKTVLEAVQLGDEEDSKAQAGVARDEACKTQAEKFKFKPLNLRLVQEWHARNIDNLRRTNY